MTAWAVKNKMPRGSVFLEQSLPDRSASADKWFAAPVFVFRCACKRTAAFNKAYYAVPCNSVIAKTRFCSNRHSQLSTLWKATRARQRRQRNNLIGFGIGVLALNKLSYPLVASVVCV
jgi:hypothetical protein